MTSHTDEYGTELEAQGLALEGRQREIDKDRENWKAAVMHYVEFLRSKGRPIPSFASQIEQPRQRPPERPYDGVSRVVRYAKPRIGEKRKKALIYIAQATMDGRYVTTQELIENAGVEQHVANNVVWSDTKRGMLERVEAKVGDFHKYKMTDLGFDILQKAGIDTQNV